MKTLFPFLTTILAGSVAFATDWPSLISLAPNLKVEKMSLDTKGLVEVEYVKLPSGQMRFVGFNSFSVPKKPVITVKADTPEHLGKFCQQAVRFGKPFKAELVVITDPLATDYRAENTPNLSSFQNPVKVSAPKITFFEKNPVWTTLDREAIRNSTGRPLTDYYEELLNEKLQQSADGVLRLDLSNRNELACDLMQGYLKFKINRTVQYEPGMPSKDTWLPLDTFTEVFQNFWRVQPSVVDARLTPTQNDLAEAVALGIAASKTLAPSDLMKSPGRIQSFLSSLKAEVRGLNATQKAAVRSTEVIDQWSMNTEFVKPSVETRSQNLVVGNFPVFVKFEK